MKHLLVYTELQEAINGLLSLRDRHVRHVKTPPQLSNPCFLFQLAKGGSIPSEVVGELCKVQEWRLEREKRRHVWIKSAKEVF